MRLDPKAKQEADTAAERARNSALPLEYVLLAEARADAMDKQWESAIKNYDLLFSRYKRLDYGLLLAAAQTEGSQAQKALETLTTLAKLPAPMGNDPRIQLATARTYGALSNYIGQLAAAQGALKEAERRNSRMMKANAQLELCWAHRNLGHVEEAFSACNS